MKNPITLLIDNALSSVERQSPHWNESQPLMFRARVVETWKQSITSSLIEGGRIEWTLPLGGDVFRVHAPLFAIIDWNYNPYILGANKSFLLVR